MSILTTNPLDRQIPKPRGQSTRRLAANRANAQLSTGPTSEAGKQRSAMNALRHGFLSSISVLQCESANNFHHVAQHYHTHFRPADDVEANYVDEMAASYWRLLRLRALETRMLDRAVSRANDGDFLDACLNGVVDGEGSVLTLLSRYEAHLSRLHFRAFRMLSEMRKRRLPVTPQLPEIEVAIDSPKGGFRSPALPVEMPLAEPPAEPSPNPPTIRRNKSRNNQTNPINEIQMPDNSSRPHPKAA